MRPGNLMAFSTWQNTYRNSCRTHNVAVQRTRTGWVSSAAKSLDLVRQNLQQHINKEISEVIKRYTDKFLVPAIENIKRNNGDNSVSDEHIHAVCRQMLDDAKRMYTTSHGRGSTPLGENSDSETGSHGEIRPINYRSSYRRKRKESDSDSETSQIIAPVRKKGRPPLYAYGGASGRVTPSKQSKSVDMIKKEGPKWDASRITNETMFIMGSKANKALGFGATRGRVYIKHPDVFKYCGDAEDKQWLYENSRMPATGGKAYLLILEDIKDLLESDEYRNSPDLVLDALMGFHVPEYMQEKMRSSMNSQRTDGGLRAIPFESESATHDQSIPRIQIKRDPDEVEEHRTVKPIKLKIQLPSSGLLEHSVSTPPHQSYLISKTLNDADSNTDLQDNMDVDPPLTARFDITECQ
ncbi:hypothetical protein CHUAL_012929 [Chamberlinius hualienensis]